VITAAELDAALIADLPELAPDQREYHRKRAEDPHAGARRAGVGMKYLFCFLLLSFVALVQDLPKEYASHFDYDARAPLDVKENSTQARGTVRVVDLSYASPKGGRVTSYLVLPAGEGPFPAVVYSHWRNTEKSPQTSNRSEFLDEAVAYAKAGTVGFMIDGVFVRPGFKADSDPFSMQESEVLTQQVIDLRRAVDLLVRRKDVNPEKIAYVGHSYDAMVGGILRAVEPRFATLVLMAGNYSTRAEMNSDDPPIVAFRKQYGDDKINAYLDKVDWTDPVHYVSLQGKAPVLLQNATHDEFGSKAMFEKSAEAVAAPKAVKWYDSGHALNADARVDRYFWLRKYIGIGNVPEETLTAIPELK
jgi:cephalosporin-C deacetylase-like acetyl esterase